MNTRFPPGIKVGTHVSATADEERLLFLRQLGIDHVRVHIAEDDDDPVFLAETVAKFSAIGLDIFSVVYGGYKAREIALGTGGREQRLDRLADFIRTMGELGLHTLDYDFFLYAPLPSTSPATVRQARSRAFDMAALPAEVPVFGQHYDDETMWANYRHMMERLLPVAEAAGVRLALHPDDPPLPTLNGCARIFRDMQAFQRAMAMTESPAWGVLFCVGTWAEGGDAMGMSIEDAIRWFAARDKLFTVHFRNVSGPLPAFVETFIDNGCVDMYKVLRTLVEVGFNGLLIPDHYPEFVSDEGEQAALAYTIGYIRALLQRAEADVAAG